MIVYIDGTSDELAEFFHGLSKQPPAPLILSPSDEVKKSAIEAWLTDHRPE